MESNRFLILAYILAFANPASPCIRLYTKEQKSYWPKAVCLPYYEDNQKVLEKTNRACKDNSVERNMLLNTTNNQINDRKGCILTQLKAITYDAGSGEILFDDKHGFKELTWKMFDRMADSKLEKSKRIRKYHIDTIIENVMGCKKDFKKIKDKPSSKWDDFYVCLDNAYFCGYLWFLNG